MASTDASTHNTRENIMAKNPFELRYDALTLARNHLMEEFYSKMELYRDLRELKPMDVPVYPTPEAIMDLAVKFKAFVDAA
jgi:hypothetical protein